MAMTKIILLVLLALVASSTAAPCNGFCANQATCDSAGVCDCTTAPHTSGVICQSCFPNYSPLTNCTTVINPCITCTSSNSSECIDTPNICPKFADCINTDSGKYKCKCNKGYSGSVKNATYPFGVCVDIDECAQKKRACPVWSKCTNTNGFFHCKCNKGRRPIYDSSGNRVLFCVTGKN